MSCLARPHPLLRHPRLHHCPHCLHMGTGGPLQLSLVVRNPTSPHSELPWDGGKILSNLSALMAVVS